MAVGAARSSGPAPASAVTTAAPNAMAVSPARSLMKDMQQPTQPPPRGIRRTRASRGLVAPAGQEVHFLKGMPKKSAFFAVHHRVGFYPSLNSPDADLLTS